MKHLSELTFDHLSSMKFDGCPSLEMKTSPDVQISWRALHPTNIWTLFGAGCPLCGYIGFPSLEVHLTPYEMPHKKLRILAGASSVNMFSYCYHAAVFPWIFSCFIYFFVVCIVFTEFFFYYQSWTKPELKGRMYISLIKYIQCGWTTRG